MKSQLSNLVKLGSAFLLFILLSSAVNAQTVKIKNFTSCDMAVSITGTVDCTGAGCVENVVVPANSNVTHTLTCTAGLSAVSVIITPDCIAPLPPSINLSTPFCACDTGADYDDGSFTDGSWTVNAAASCDGDNMQVKIWD